MSALLEYISQSRALPALIHVAFHFCITFSTNSSTSRQSKLANDYNSCFTLANGIGKSEGAVLSTCVCVGGGGGGGGESFPSQAPCPPISPPLFVSTV